MRDVFQRPTLLRRRTGRCVVSALAATSALLIAGSAASQAGGASGPGGAGQGGQGTAAASAPSGTSAPATPAANSGHAPGRTPRAAQQQQQQQQQPAATTPGASATPLVQPAAPAAQTPANTGPTPMAPIPMDSAHLADVAGVAGPGFTLQQALEVMNRTHPQLQVTRAATRAAEHDVTSAGLWTNPQLNVTYQHALTAASAYDPLLGYIQVGATQLIETANLPGARREAATATLNATRSDGEAVRRGLMFDVYAAFVAVAGAAGRLLIYQQTAVQLEQAANIVRQRVAAGATADYDLRRITLALADARAGVDDAQADLINARGLFDVAVGPASTQLQGLPQIDLQSRPDVPSLNSLLETMTRERPELRALRSRVQAAGAQVQVARRSVFQGVQLYVGLAYGTNNQYSYCEGLNANQSPLPWTMPAGNPRSCGAQGNIGPEIDLSAGVTLPLPIFDRGQGAIPAAEARASNAQLSVDAFQTAAEQRVRSAYDEYIRRRQGLEHYLATGAAESTTLLLSEAQASYREGRTNILDLVDAYNTVRDARLRLGSLAADMRSAEINLWRAVGAMPAIPAPGAQ